MTDIFNVSTDTIFAASLSQYAQLEDIARRTLERGLKAFTDEDYTTAIAAFRQVTGMVPSTETGINAYQYMAKSYLNQGDSQAAIETFKKAIGAAPSRDDLRVSLGNLYYSEERYAEARAEYEQAVKLNPGAANRYSLGQGYMAEGQYDQAEAQFNQARTLAPNEPQNYHALGQLYAKQGRQDAALAALDQAIRIDKEYWDAYTEKGYIYADMGDMDQAQAMVAALKDKNGTLADILSAYISDRTAPQMTEVLDTKRTDFFLSLLGPKTSVSLLGDKLTQPGGEQTLSMVFQFSKPMDLNSVQNVTNWRIERDPMESVIPGYNFGLPIPDTEVNLPVMPSAVYYDSTNMTATVLFTLRQNEAGNGTIDPSHVRFTFLGTDADGLSMDPDADQYTGFSGFA